MCFTKEQSFVNTFLLWAVAFYIYPRWELSLGLIFLSFKDLIQGLSYYSIEKKNDKMNKILTSLSWIHICFQPLFVNLILSYFDKSKKTFWYFIFILCIIFGLYKITILNEFDIQDDPDCDYKLTSSKNDFCSKNTYSYIGKYHIGYRFRTDNKVKITSWIYILLMFVPVIFTKAKLLGLIWSIFVSIIFFIGYLKNIGSGERAAIWCFLSIIIGIPISLFSEQIKKFLL